MPCQLVESSLSQALRCSDVDHDRTQTTGDNVSRADHGQNDLTSGPIRNTSLYRLTFCTVAENESHIMLKT